MLASTIRELTASHAFKAIHRQVIIFLNYNSTAFNMKVKALAFKQGSNMNHHFATSASCIASAHSPSM